MSPTQLFFAIFVWNFKMNCNFPSLFLRSKRTNECNMSAQYAGFHLNTSNLQWLCSLGKCINGRCEIWINDLKIYQIHCRGPQLWLSKKLTNRLNVSVDELSLCQYLLKLILIFSKEFYHSNLKLSDSIYTSNDFFREMYL